MSDEAHFHFNGDVNKQKFLYRAVNNPRQINKKTIPFAQSSRFVVSSFIIVVRTFLKMRMVKR